jgi:hypothetical protein
MNKLLDLVGRGQISVTSASEIAGCVAPFSWFKMFFKLGDSFLWDLVLVT